MLGAVTRLSGTRGSGSLFGAFLSLFSLSQEMLTPFLFILSAAKIFTDGALGSWGAAMHEPYSDASEKKGILISPAEDIQPLVEKVRRFFPTSLLFRLTHPFLSQWVEKVRIRSFLHSSPY
jgi:hypothetical protein